MPLHFLQLYWSTLGELIAEWLGRASGVIVSHCVYVCQWLMPH